MWRTCLRTPQAAALLASMLQACAHAQLSGSNEPRGEEGGEVDLTASAAACAAASLRLRQAAGEVAKGGCSGPCASSAALRAHHGRGRLVCLAREASTSGPGGRSGPRGASTEGRRACCALVAADAPRLVVTLNTRLRAGVYSWLADQGAPRCAAALRPTSTPAELSVEMGRVMALVRVCAACLCRVYGPRHGPGPRNGPDACHGPGACLCRARTLPQHAPCVSKICFGGGPLPALSTA